MPHFSLKRLLVCTALICAAIAAGQAQFQLIRAERGSTWFLGALSMLSSGLFFCGLLWLDRNSRKWWIVSTIVGTAFAYFTLRRLEFALSQNMFRPLR
jgi:hypothetical protein